MIILFNKLIADFLEIYVGYMDEYIVYLGNLV